jgi:beta-alanine degradation protein BauB
VTKVAYLVLGIVLGALGSSGARLLMAQDPVKLSPQNYKVRIDNDRVRVLEFHLKPGESEPMHSHPPGFVYSFSDATLRMTLPDGSKSNDQLHAGDLYWREATTHAAENIGNTEAHALALELKPCKP